MGFTRSLHILTVATVLCSAGRGWARSVAPAIDSMLQTVRSQLDLYSMEHPDEPFDPAMGWSQLIEGSYLPEEPRNPIAEGRTAISVGADPDPTAGWAWCPDPTGAVEGLDVWPRNRDGIVLDDSYEILWQASGLDRERSCYVGPNLWIGAAIVGGLLGAWLVGRRVATTLIP